MTEGEFTLEDLYPSEHESVSYWLRMEGRRESGEKI